MAASSCRAVLSAELGRRCRTSSRYRSVHLWRQRRRPSRSGPHFSPSGSAHAPRPGRFAPRRSGDGSQAGAFRLGAVAIPAEGSNPHPQPAPPTSHLMCDAGKRCYRRRPGRRRAVGRCAGRQVRICTRQPCRDGHISRIARWAHPEPDVWCGAMGAASGWLVVGRDNHVGGIARLERYYSWRGVVMPGAEHGRLHMPQTRCSSRGRQPDHDRPAAHTARGLAVVSELEVAAGLARQSAGVDDADFQLRDGTGVDAGR